MEFLHVNHRNLTLGGIAHESTEDAHSLSRGSWASRGTAREWRLDYAQEPGYWCIGKRSSLQG